MKNRLVNTVIFPLAVFTGLSLAACRTTPKGRAFGDFIAHTAADEFVRGEIKSLQGHRDYQEQKETTVNVYQGGQERRRNNLPENVVWDGKGYNTAPGYTWVNPSDNNDLRVIKEERILGDHLWTSEEKKLMDKYYGLLSLDQIEQLEYLKENHPKLTKREIILEYIKITPNQRKRVDKYFSK